MRFYRILSTATAAISNAAAVTAMAAKTEPWRCRIMLDVPAYIKVGGVATTSDLYHTEVTDLPLLVAAGEIVSVLGTGAGNVSVSEVSIG